MANAAIHVTACQTVIGWVYAVTVTGSSGVNLVHVSGTVPQLLSRDCDYVELGEYLARELARGLRCGQETLQLGNDTLDLL